MSYVVTPAQFRATAHKIADVIYQALTGDVGVFSTRIAYITKQGPRFQLFVADADGDNPQAVVASNEPLLSPAWSPDGSRLAYVSLENRKPVVYVQSLATGQRQVLANFRGSNSAPAWAPDGRRLAVTLTKDGGSQVFLMNADGTGVPRLMSSASIDTEANFTPDGRSILFTSDRGGTPQVYRLDIASGTVARLTFEGSYNASPRATPDGKGFVFVRREGGRFQVAIQDYATRQVQVLTQGPLDESPSVSPNSKLILYAAMERGGRGILAAVSADGRVKQRLVSRRRTMCASPRGARCRADRAPVLRTSTGDNDAMDHRGFPRWRCLAGCQSTRTQEAAPIEERAGATTRPAPRAARRPAASPPRRSAARRPALGGGDEPAEGPGEHPVEAYRVLRLRPASRSRTRTRR